MVIDADPPNANGTRSRSSSTPVTTMTLPPGASAAARKEAICEVIRRTGLHPLHAARSVGVSSSAYYRLVEGDQDFRDEIDAATSTFARHMAAVVARAAVTLGSWRAAAFWLERRLPDLYGPRLDLSIEEKPIESEIEERYSQEQIDERLRLLAEEALRRVEARS
jgi:hypothetical protein